MAPTTSSTVVPTHGTKCVTSELGHHFVSPKKPRDKKKTQTSVKLPGIQVKCRQLLARMQKLINPELKQIEIVDTETTSNMDQADQVVADIPDPDFEIPAECPSDILVEDPPNKRWTVPDKSTDMLYSSWKALIPALVDPHLNMCYIFMPSKTDLDRFISIDVLSCRCSTLPQVLIHHGLFPTAPSQPCMAISVELLSFYRALFEHSCGAINALASALKTHYSRRGFVMTDIRGEIIQEPFRRGLGYTVQWYDMLQIQIKCKVKEALQNSHQQVATFRSQAEDQVATSTPLSTLHKGRCTSILVQRCPMAISITATSVLQEIVLASTIRLTSSRKTHVPVVPDEAIDQCETAYEAADGKKQKAAMDSFDDTGIMALICHHDIPLFFANIDSLGEQQKYSVALLEHLFGLIPPHATVVALYDVGCVLARSLGKYDILPNHIVSHLHFATTAMHAYGHEWACQLVYNPCAPACLKKELDTVLALQADLDASNTTLHSTRFMFEKGAASQDTLEALKALKSGHDQLMGKVEVLYASLNIHNQFPELEGINLEFVRLLLMARDLKMNIRKWAIASFLEWDKLDRAVGGAQQALGTKLHQQTRKVIAKRQPALLTAIQKFNAYCEHLEALYDPSWGIPLPSPLPTKLMELHSDHSLMEDMWITLSNGEVPQWLEDADVRDGIHALLKCKHCREEQKRLGIEADNLCHFFGEELAALELALHTPGCELVSVLLRQRHDCFLRLQTHWANPLASSLCFASYAKDALVIAVTLSGGSQMSNLNWLGTTFLEVPDPESDLNDVEFSEPHDLPVIESEQVALRSKCIVITSMSMIT
ncbi:hypothetical protein DFJ58DRAFT_730530 [Suillus subalutaceus]|uniref:uncharacterized protein n=1 Tax=Suillus subalutaceus TaxID=48586 RepID=UPI001B85C5E2|nr:uncharacterized protein DFJ58DRAFT_730530 [Suillus subalutaceus]KAG1846399.1 hypothetical protein DFJ58DRAFT_730530 [Suillus subalutaceus]